jgi:integrase
VLKGAQKSQERTLLSKADIEVLLGATDLNSRSGIRDRTLILLIVYGALRRSEVAALDIDDVRPLGRHWIIDLPRHAQASGGYVKIPARAADAVQQLAEVYGDDSGPMWRSFSNRNWGERMSADALYKRVRRLGTEADLEKVSIQILRHSALRLASEAGASLEQIRDHARVKRKASAVEYVDNRSRASRLQSTAADVLDLDV